MGLIQSTESLINSIDKTVDELSEYYKSNYLNGSFCDNLKLYSVNRLNRFTKSELLELNYMLGIESLNKENNGEIPNKRELCNAITEHYILKLKLINLIKDSLVFCKNRLHAGYNGRICKGDPEAFNDDCTSGWIDDPEEYTSDEWKSEFINMNNNFYSSAELLNNILLQIRDSENILTDEVLKELYDDAESIIKNMNNTCSNTYKRLLSIK